MSLSVIARNVQGAVDHGGDATAEYPVLIGGSEHTVGTKRRLVTTPDGFLYVTAVAAGGTAAEVQGTVADGAAVGTQKPITISGVDGGDLVQRLMVESAASPNLRSAIYAGASGPVTVSAIGDGDTNSLTHLFTASRGQIWNGATWDRCSSANNANGASGTGNGAVPASGLMVHDGTNWRRLLAQSAGSANLRVTLYNGGQDAQVLAAADSVAQSSSTLWTVGFNSQFNRSTWDRLRGNSDNTGLAGAPRTTTQTVTFTVYNEQFLAVVLDMTDVTAGPSVTVTIDAQDAVSGKWINVLTGLAITTVSTNTYKVGVGLTAAANATANDFLRRNMRIVITANNANSGTYSMGYQLSRGS